MKTTDLIGPALDWAVAQCEPDFNFKLMKHVNWPDDEYWVQDFDGVIYHHEEIQNNSSRNRRYDKTPWSPSADWSQGGPIIEREKISRLYHHPGTEDVWACIGDPRDDYTLGHTGPTELIAAMRCYVASKIGDEIEVPKELL